MGVSLAGWVTRAEIPSCAEDRDDNDDACGCAKCIMVC
jgi:hypothetical protein